MSHIAVLFTDASVRTAGTGCGFVGLFAGKILLGCRPLPPAPDSGVAEAKAVDLAVEAMRDQFRTIRRIIVFSDNTSVVEAINGTKGAPWRTQKHIVSMLGMARLDKITVEARWVKGHQRKRPRHYGNDVAHGLADLGRGGTDKTMLLPFDRQWRQTIRGFDPRLNRMPIPEWLGYDLVAQELGISVDVVMKLIRHGHLETMGYSVSKKSFLKVRDFMLSKNMLA